MNNRSNVTLPVALLMTILVVGLVYAIFVRPNFHRIAGGDIKFDATYVARLNTDLGETVSRMGDFLYVASEEGLTKYNQQGESIWNKSYHIDELLFIVADPYIAVVNLTGKTAYIFDENGSTAEIATDYAIVGGYLNAKGYLCLSLENEEENYIYLYNPLGETIVKRLTMFREDGYPIDVAMSQDGTRMMTSHLDVSQHMIESNITFLDFSTTGKEFEDRIVGHQSMTETMASKLIFLDDSHGSVIGDNELRFFEINPTPALLNTVKVAALIKQVVQSGDQLVVSYGEATLPEGDATANSVVVYSAKGVVLEHYRYDDPVTGLLGEDGTFYVIQSSKVTCYESGSHLWETLLYKPVDAIYHLNSDKYLLKFEYDYEVVEIRDI